MATPHMKITRDWLTEEGEDSRTGEEHNFTSLRHGPFTTDGPPEFPDDAPTVLFKLADEDGETHYTGVCVDDDDVMEFVWRWGMYDTGATEFFTRRRANEPWEGPVFG